MKFVNKEAQIYIPDSEPVIDALKRTTHMAVAAHQDDIEIMAYHGIEKCFGSKENWICGVVLTDGAGSARDGIYKDYNDEQMKNIRKIEQKKAAYIGEYGSLAMLDYPSANVKSADCSDLLRELKEILELASPDIVYTHNPADKHSTHVAATLRTIAAIRLLSRDKRPKKLYGCEVWRSLDWLVDSDRILIDVSGHPNIAASLVGVYDSQICGGKRYDKATLGRRRANATYSESHSLDKAEAMSIGIDLTPLISNEDLDIVQYIQSYIARFGDDIENRIKRLL